MTTKPKKSRTKTAPIKTDPTIKDYRTIPALKAYVDRIGAEQFAAGKFMIKKEGTDKLHYYTEKCVIIVNPNGTTWCKMPEYAPTKEEAQNILSVVSQLKWPKSVKITPTQAEAQRKKLKVPEDLWFVFWDVNRKHIIMCQQRIDPDHRKQTRKAYVPWTLYDDGEWHNMEPVGISGLPFWKPETKREKPIMVHEGGKSGRFCDNLVNSNEPFFRDLRKKHPFFDFLKQYEHWGWIGGALAPERTNYQELRSAIGNKIARFICDNDHEGRKALEKISENYEHQMMGLYFDQSFPEGYDLADEIPKDMYENGNYIGKLMEDMDWKPATWATEKFKGEGGKIYHRVRREFTKTITHVVRPDVFIFNFKPHELLTPNEFNDMVSPYSHVSDTAELVRKDASIKNNQLTYMPWRDPGPFLDSDRTNKFNCHMPSIIKERAGKLDPWFEYLEHLITDKSDRHLTEKFIATVIARPQTKMAFGMLLRSETQGVGKSALGEHVLAPILGKHNVSFPSEQQVVESAFNDFLAFKRLVFIHEIYQGSSAKAYNKMKPLFTDVSIEINKKHMALFRIENVVNIICCSNSSFALRIKDDDRRLLIPKVNESLKDHKWWMDFHEWLYNRNGLGRIFAWAKEYDDYFLPGEHAPDTTEKRDFVRKQYSEGMDRVANILAAAKSEINGKATYILDTEVRAMLIDDQYGGNPNGKKVESLATIRKLASNAGFFVHNKRAFSKELGTLATGPIMICTNADDLKKTPAEIIKDRGKPFNIRGFSDKQGRM